MLALEALPEDLFDQIICLVIIVGIVIYAIILAIRGEGPEL